MAKLLYFGERTKSNMSESSAGAIDHCSTPSTPSAINSLPQAASPAPKAAVNSQRDTFDDLLAQGKAAVDRSEYQAALAMYDTATEWAHLHGDSADVDRVSCCRFAISLHTGEAETAVTSLRMILMRSTNPINQFMAAYNVSYYYEAKEDFEKSRFYADLALDHAKQSATGYFLAMGHSHLGNLLIRDSYFVEALDHYEESLTHFEEEEEYKRLAIIANMGFCHLACENFDTGFSNLFMVRRRYRQLQLGPSIATGRVRLAFCFGYLELKKFHQAILHGKKAMEIGQECGDQDVIKKALYLLGETEKLRGDEMKAFVYFANLQEDFFPNIPSLPEILLYNETNKVVNLWA